MKKDAGVLLLILLFTSLNQAERANLTTLLRRLTLRKGDVLFRKGDEGTALYIKNNVLSEDDIIFTAWMVALSMPL